MGHALCQPEDYSVATDAFGNVYVSGFLSHNVFRISFCDDAANLETYAEFAACLTGPAGGMSAPCACADRDADARTDLFDYAWLQNDFDLP